MNRTPTPLERTCRERVIVTLLQHLADDHLETVTLEVDLAAWLILALNDEQLEQLASHVLKGIR